MANQQAPRDGNQVPTLLVVDDITGFTVPVRTDSNGNLLVTGSITGATVPDGGTGVSSFTAYAPIFGGTTSTGALQSGTVGSSGQVLTSNGAGALPTFQANAASGTVTSVSVASANGFAGTVATATTTPAITLSTTITGILSGNGTAISAATTTGSGSVVLATSPAISSPTLTTPVLGVASATSVNKVTITTPATGSTLTLIDGKTLTINKTISLTAADDTGVYTLPTGTKTLVATDVATLSSLASVGTITTGTWNGTVVDVAHGGSGRASTTAYAVICGGTTSTGAEQSIASVGTSGQVLTSNGASALPTFQTAASSGTDMFSTTLFTYASDAVASACKTTTSGTGTVTNAASLGGVLTASAGAVAGGTAYASVGLDGIAGFMQGYNKNMSVRALLSIAQGTKGASTVTRFYAFADNVNPSSATIYAGFRVNNTTVSAVTKDGTTETATTITGSALDNFDVCVIDIIFTSGTNVVFKVNGSTVATHTTNLPPTADSSTSHAVFSMGVINTGSSADLYIPMHSYVYQRTF